MSVLTLHSALEKLAQHWLDAQSPKRPENDPYYEGVYDARHECSEQLRSVLAAVELEKL